MVFLQNIWHSTVYWPVFVVDLSLNAERSSSIGFEFINNLNNYEMTVTETADAQLPSILVGDGVLLPVKIDITMSGNILCSLLFDYMLFNEN